MPLLDELSKEKRKEIVKTATVAYKTGAEPHQETEPHKMSRAEHRQLARALGWRGKKAKRHNIERRTQLAQKAVLTDAALQEAQERVLHPVRSRIRRR